MKTLLIIFLTLNLYAGTKEKMLTLYQSNQYEDACNIGFDNYTRYMRDEDFLSLYAFACLKSDYIDRLALPVATLKFSPAARANSAYLSIILMQKKLLYHALVDNYDLSNLNLPTTDYVLSKVFDLYSNLGKHDRKSLYIFEDKNDPKLKYKFYLTKTGGINKMIIEELYDQLTTKTHVYW